jgi:hypothetical protein
MSTDAYIKPTASRLARPPLPPAATVVSAMVVLLGLALALVGLRILPGGPEDAAMAKPLVAAGISLGAAGLSLGLWIVGRRPTRPANARDPERPWLTDRPWDPSGQTDDHLRHWRRALFTTFCVGGLLLPWDHLYLSNPASDLSLWGVLLLLLNLPLLLAVGFLLRETVRHFKYGTTQIAYSSFPLRPQDIIGLAFSPNRFAQLTATLTCQEEFYVQELVDDQGHSKPVARCIQHWQDRKRIAPNLDDPEVEIEFVLPSDYLLSTRLDDPTHCLYWELAVESAQPGVNFAARFLLPLYDCPPDATTESPRAPLPAPPAFVQRPYAFEAMALAVLLATAGGLWWVRSGPSTPVAVAVNAPVTAASTPTPAAPVATPPPPSAHAPGQKAAQRQSWKETDEQLTMRIRKEVLARRTYLRDGPQAIPEAVNQLRKLTATYIKQGMLEANALLQAEAEIAPKFDGNTETVAWIQDRAEHEDAVARYRLGQGYARGLGLPTDPDEAQRWFRLAAGQGHPLAQFALGRAYFLGEGVPQDQDEAVKWFRTAAEQGHALSQALMGNSYRLGRGVPEDQKEAVRWYRQAAAQGDYLAQFYLGNALENGQGVAQDLDEAYQLFLGTAEQGHTWAQFRVGVFYAEGKSVPKDLVTALQWVLLAGGHLAYEDLGRGAQIRQDLLAQLTPEEIALAKGRAKAWKPKSRPGAAAAPGEPLEP